ncbi:MAG: VWA domain-containing protein [Anaerolineales bacterium]|nr:VWA domain-containing protein [Anaerolineales bacterium]
MRRIRIFLMPVLLLPVFLAAALPVQADGIIIPDPPICDPMPCPRPFPITQLAIEYHRVQVTIEDQIATTHVDQIFRNDNDWQVEGTYIFPIPEGASISSFTLWIDGEPVEGEVLTREEARKIYEQIVWNLRDPALLEYIDRGAVQASIFPIPPGGKRRIQLEYTEVLAADNGLIHYRYPLNTEKFSTEPLEEVTITIRVESSVPIKAVYSPTHEVSIDRDGDYEFAMGYEEYKVIPDKDFDLFYSVSEQDLSLNLITYRDPLSEDDDGFFLLLAAPSVEIDPTESIAKDVILVLDRSGSMEGEKLQQAQEALKFVLDHLNPEDHFNIISFSTGTKTFAQSLQSVDEVREAKRWVDSLSAQGATDINLALLEALSMARGQRPTIVIFLTDGLPTEGEVETEDILENVAEASPDNVRLFAFGVGYDVDTFLLDSLAKENHGTTTYVTPDQDIDESVSSFFAKVNDPVLTNPELDFGDIVVYDLHPEPLPDIFAGTQVVLVGRYKDYGVETIELSGKVNGSTYRFKYHEQRFRAEGGPEFLPRLWATRKIGALLNQVRLEGPEQELIDQIVRLSIRYGIITPYTSFLVTEPDALGMEAQDAISEDTFNKLLEAPMVVSGEGAVERAAEEAEIWAAEVPVGPEGEAANIVKIAGANTYRWFDSMWVDTRFDPDTMITQKVPFLSDDYFSLAERSSDLAAAFALGDRVIAIEGGIAYEVVGMEDDGDDITLPIVSEDIADDHPDVVDDTSSSQSEERSSFPGCPGIVFAAGLVILPLGFISKKK